MSDAVVNIGATFDSSNFNAEIKRSGEALSKAFEGVLSKDQLQGLESILNKFSQTKDIGAARSQGVSAFGEIERQNEEKKQNALSDIRKRYDTQRQAISQGEGTDFSKKLKLAALDKKEAASSNIVDNSKDVKDVEKKWNSFLKTVGKGLDDEDDDAHSRNKKRIGQHINLLEQSLNDVHSKKGSDVLGGHVNRLGKRGADYLGDKVAGEDGAGSFLGMSGGMVAGLAGGLAVAVGFAISQGYEQLRAQNKLESMTDLTSLLGKGNEGNFNSQFGGGSGYANLGFGLDEMRQLIGSTTREQGFVGKSGDSRINAAVFDRDLYRKATIQRGFGLESGDVGQFDRFTRTESSGMNGVDVITNILERSEKSGILGVSGGDFAGAAQAMKNVSAIMSFQSSKGDMVDSNLATSLMLGGAAINGGLSSFGGSQGAQTMTNMLSSLTNPQNDGMKAMMFRLAQQADPNANSFELQANISSGDSKYISKALDFAGGIVRGGGSRAMKEYSLQSVFHDLNGKQIETLMAHYGEFEKAYKSAPSDNERQKLLSTFSGRALDSVTNLDGFWTNLKDYLQEICGYLAKMTDSLGGQTSADNKAMDSAYNTTYKDVYARDLQAGKTPDQAKADATTAGNEARMKAGAQRNGISVKQFTKQKAVEDEVGTGIGAF